MRLFSSRKSLSASPPRGTTMSAVLASLTSSPRSSREPSIEITTSAGSPTATSPARTVSPSTALLLTAAAEPRRSATLPDLMHSAATSTVTFGRDSYTTRTRPIGTQTLLSSSPLCRRRSSTTRPTGSGSAATSRTDWANAARRSSLSVRRSTSEAAVFEATATATSSALAARIAAAFRSSSVAIACRAASRRSVSALRSARAAERPRLLMSEFVVALMRGGYRL